MTLFNEQALRDSGFQTFKDQVISLDKNLDRLNRGGINSDSPGSVHCSLKRDGETLESLKKEAARFRKATQVIQGLEFKIDWTMTDTSMNLKFAGEGNYLDLHDRIREGLKAEPKGRPTRDASVEGVFGREGFPMSPERDYGGSTSANKRRSFLDFPSGSMTPNNGRSGTPVLNSVRTQATLLTDRGGFRDNIFAGGPESEETKKNLIVVAPIPVADTNWGESDMVLDELDIPSLKSSVQLQSKTTSTVEPPDNYVRRLTALDIPNNPKFQTQPQQLNSGQIGLPMRSPGQEGFGIKQVPTRPYVSQRKIPGESLPSPVMESQRVVYSPPVATTECGIISNQAIDETKFKLILSELKSSQKMFEKIEFINNTFKFAYYKLLRTILNERMSCEVKIDESKNKVQIKQKLTKKELDAFKSLNIMILQV